MKIIIDIDERVYEVINHFKSALIGVPIGGTAGEALVAAVLNGMPLPKGHRRLLDERKMLERLEDWHTNDAMDIAHYNFTLNRIIESDTIIEADKDDKQE